jgi:ABC-type oligopeptide transport system substrate-binding subunit
MPLDQLGVKKIDDYTFSITTTNPIPYFLDIANWHFLVPKHEVDKLGNAWADSPETAVSNGPFVIQEWDKGSKVVFGLNPDYNGPWKPKVEHMEMILVPATNAPYLQMFQTKEVDSISLTGDQLAQTLNDPSMKGEVYPQGAFTTAYLFFDDSKPPFNNLKVRQAFSHAIDRDSLKTVMQNLIVPAYGMLPEGFPCSQNDDPAFRQIQAYDPAMAKQLLADAGFPNGQGFPTLELWTRGGQYTREAEAIQNMLKQNLGITVSVKDQERDFYMTQLAAHAIQFGLLQWGADYPDPTDFLDWWGDQSRHTWKNDQFNQLITQARSDLNPTERCGLYNQAEKILVSDVGGVFVEYPVVGSLFQSYVGGLPLNSNGLPGVLTQVIEPSVYVKQH